MTLADLQGGPLDGEVIPGEGYQLVFPGQLEAPVYYRPGPIEPIEVKRIIYERRDYTDDVAAYVWSLAPHSWIPLAVRRCL